MTYQVQFAIIHQPSCKAEIVTQQITTEILGPTYEDLVGEFFRQWDKEDKYSGDYIIGVISMKYDN